MQSLEQGGQVDCSVIVVMDDVGIVGSACNHWNKVVRWTVALSL